MSVYLVVWDVEVDGLDVEEPGFVGFVGVVGFDGVELSSIIDTETLLEPGLYSFASASENPAVGVAVIVTTPLFPAVTVIDSVFCSTQTLDFDSLPLETERLTLPIQSPPTLIVNVALGFTLLVEALILKDAALTGITRIIIKKMNIINKFFNFIKNTPQNSRVVYHILCNMNSV